MIGARDSGDGASPSVTVSVSDGYGGTAQQIFWINIRSNDPPEITLTQVAINYAGAAGWEVSLIGHVGGDMRHGARILARFEELGWTSAR